MAVLRREEQNPMCEILGDLHLQDGEMRKCLRSVQTNRWECLLDGTNLEWGYLPRHAQRRACDKLGGKPCLPKRFYYTIIQSFQTSLWHCEVTSILYVWTFTTTTVRWSEKTLLTQQASRLGNPYKVIKLATQFSKVEARTCDIVTPYRAQVCVYRVDQIQTRLQRTHCWTVIWRMPNFSGKRRRTRSSSRCSNVSQRKLRIVDISTDPPAEQSPQLPWAYSMPTNPRAHLQHIRSRRSQQKKPYIHTRAALQNPCTSPNPITTSYRFTHTRTRPRCNQSKRADQLE